MVGCSYQFVLVEKLISAARGGYTFTTYTVTLYLTIVKSIVAEDNNLPLPIYHADMSIVSVKVDPCILMCSIHTLNIYALT